METKSNQASRCSINRKIPAGRLQDHLSEGSRNFKNLLKIIIALSCVVVSIPASQADVANSKAPHEKCDDDLKFQEYLSGHREGELFYDEEYITKLKLCKIVVRKINCALKALQTCEESCSRKFYPTGFQHSACTIF